MSDQENSTFSGWRKCSGWRRNIPAWIWYDISLTKPRPYVGWETDDKGNPWFVMMEHTRRGDDFEVESREIAVKWDGEATGLFYQRDWTRSSLLFCSEGELYWSGWWFQFRCDAEKFLDIYGGIGSWQDDYEEKAAEMRKRSEQ